MRLRTMTCDATSSQASWRTFRMSANIFRDKYALSRTSGSQGQPLLLMQTKDIIDLLFALHVSRGNNKRVGLIDAVKHMLRPARLAVIIFKPGFYASSSAFSYMPQAAKHYMRVKVFCWNDEDLIEQLGRIPADASHRLRQHAPRNCAANRSRAISLKPELEEVVNISERLMPQAREHYTNCSAHRCSTTTAWANACFSPTAARRAAACTSTPIGQSSKSLMKTTGRSRLAKRCEGAGHESGQLCAADHPLRNRRHRHDGDRALRLRQQLAAHRPASKAATRTCSTSKRTMARDRCSPRSFRSRLGACWTFASTN